MFISTFILYIYIYIYKILDEGSSSFSQENSYVESNDSTSYDNPLKAEYFIFIIIINNKYEINIIIFK